MQLPEGPEELVNAISWAPWMAWTAAASAVGLVVLVALYRWTRRARPVLTSPGGEAAAAVTAAGPLAALGACGMLLSVYGLFGFATDNMELNWYWAVPVIAIFDLAELCSFVSLYRSAAVEKGWTRPMRQTRRMAWALVAASSAMNAAHAPGNALATVAFAAVPPISAKLIEFELDKRMAANSDDSHDDAIPGLVRLVQIAYARGWARVFAHLGWDATARDGLVHHEARIQTAAKRLHQLRAALERKDNAPEGRRAGRATKRVEQLQGEVQRAIDVAGIAGDTPAQLALARAFATKGRVVDLAKMDPRDPMAMLRLLEELAIVPSAEAIAAGAAAAEAKKEQQAAEEARDRACKELEALQVKASEVRASATEQHAEAEALMKTAQEAVAQAEKEGEAAGRRAAEAVRAAAEADDRRQQLANEIEQLEKAASGLRETAGAEEEMHQALTQQLTELNGAIQQAERQVDEQRAEAAAQRAEAERAAAQKLKAREVIHQTEQHTTRLQQEVTALQVETEQLADERARQATAVERLTAEAREAHAAAQQAQETADRALAQAQEAENTRRAATVALQSARDQLMDALTDPEPYTPPRWTSEHKMHGWELYLHKVSVEGVEPTDAELAGEHRDPSTGRRWLVEFRTELARRTAAALPAQEDAHGRTTDRTPALA